MDTGLDPKAEQVPNTFWYVSERASEDGHKDIYFQVKKPGCPSDQQALKNEVERVLSVLKILYPDLANHRFNDAFAKLLALSQLGLAGAKPSTLIAKSALDSLKQEVVDREAGRVKNDYMIKLGRWGILFSGVALLGYWVLSACSQALAPLSEYRNFLLLWTGCMVGAWCSFATRKVLLTFFDLARLEEDLIEPPLRLALAGLLTTILGLVFVTGFANLVIGTFQASDFLKNATVALLTGALAGMAEKALPAAVMQRAQSAFSRDLDSSDGKKLSD